MDPQGLLPSKDRIDEAIQERTRRKFIEEEKENALKKLLPNEVQSQFAYLKESLFPWNDAKKMEFNGQMERPTEDKRSSVGIGGDETDSYFERGSITSDKFGTLSSDKIKAAVSYAAFLTTVVETSVSINNATWGGLLIAIEDVDDPNRVIFGHPEITAYKTSVADANRIPQGSSTIGDQHLVLSYFDLHYNETLLSRPGKDLGYVHLIRNNSGGNDTYYFRYRWRVLGNAVD